MRKTKKPVVKLWATPEEAQEMADKWERLRPGKKFAVWHETGQEGEKAQVFITERD